MPTLNGVDIVIDSPQLIGEVDYVPTAAPGVAIAPVGGPPGPVGGTVHTPGSPTANETFSHTLGRIPNVAIYVAGELVETDITATTNQVTVTFPNPTMYTAVLT